MRIPSHDFGRWVQMGDHHDIERGWCVIGMAEEY